MSFKYLHREVSEIIGSENISNFYDSLYIYHDVFNLIQSLVIYTTVTRRSLTTINLLYAQLDWRIRIVPQTLVAAEEPNEAKMFWLQRSKD